MIRLTRRDFLRAAVAGATVAVGAPRSTPAQEIRSAASKEPPPLIDMHVHLFGVGDGGTGCRMSEKQRRHINYRYFLTLLGLSENGRMDADYLAFLVRQMRTTAVHKAALQAWDCRYDAKGLPDWAATTSLYVPNEYLFQVVKQHPDLFLACASINPRRRDWKDEVDRCAEAGARMVKVHPPTMDVDPADAKYRDFYRHCAKRRLVLMFHTGAEHAADVVSLEVCDPARLEPALEEGCTVIAAHAGMAAFFDTLDFYPSLVRLIGRHRNLYFDTSVLASMFRWRNLPRILDTPGLIERAVHGSDFPFPPNAAVFWNRISPRALARLLQEKNLIERDYRLKQALGLPKDVFTRGARLLLS